MKSLQTLGFLLFLMLALLAGGCAAYRTPVMPPNGLLFSNVKAPTSTEFYQTTKVPTKTGESSSYSVLGLFAFGDASIQAAAEKGQLSSIHFVDYDYLSVLFGVYTRFTTVANGE